MSKKTKWIPLGNFSFGGKDYITFTRKNLKSGMLYFKTKRVNTWFGFFPLVNSVIPRNLIDVKSAWEQITNER